MTKEQIIRKSFSSTDKVTTEADLAFIPSLDRQKVMKSLGYDMDAREPKKPEDGNKSFILAKALQELDIQYLDFTSVMKYQNDKINEAHNKLFEEFIESRAVPKYRDTIAWKRVEISDKYDKVYIPDHVLLKALEIKEKCPQVRFHVEYLERTPDPFLVAEVGSEWDPSERYYVEVWDEPMFVE